MKNFDLKRILSSALDESVFLKKRRTVSLVVFLFMTFFFTGIFFSMYISSQDKASLSEAVCKMMSDGGHSPLPSMMSNLVLIILIFAAGISIYGFLLALVILCCKALSLGFCSGLFFAASEVPWIKIMLCSLIPVNLPVVISFITSACASTCYAITVLQDRSQRQICTKEYLLFFALSAVFLMLSMFIDILSIRIMRT